MKNDKDLRFGTRAVHGGQEPDPLTGAVMTPIYQTSTYAQTGPGKHKGYEYSRTANPTRKALEACIASLEMGNFGIAFASGMASISTLAQLFKSGNHIVCSDDVYGGTFRLFDKIYKNFGLEFSFVDTSNTKNIEAVLTGKTKLIWIESPTNPTLKITDIAAVSKIANSKGIMLGVDNTFMSPYFQRPLELGADLVMHSTTKYIAGHSDIVGGALVTSDPELAEKLYFTQNAAGPVPAPQDCFLTLRGIKTLHLRMERHEHNAGRIFEYLRSQKSVKKIYYPGDLDHPGHNIQKNQASGFGAMISFDIETLNNAKKFMSKLEIFTIAESLGGVESLVEHPAI
ncbi:MAG: aminotransferase class I/II-fold pyridoxal phosphate-dependent enzyme, partial [candidate division Zixibacteria bacterium]